MKKYVFYPFQKEGLFGRAEHDISYFKDRYNDVVEFFNKPEIKASLDPLNLTGLIDTWINWSGHFHIVECMLTGLFLAGVELSLTMEEIEKYDRIASTSGNWKDYWVEEKL